MSKRPPEESTPSAVVALEPTSPAPDLAPPALEAPRSEAPEEVDVNVLGWEVVARGRELPTTLRAAIPGGTLYAVHGAGVIFVPAVAVAPTRPAPAPPAQVAPAPVQATNTEGQDLAEVAGAWAGKAAGAEPAPTPTPTPIPITGEIVADARMFHCDWAMIPTLATEDYRQKLVDTIEKRLERRKLPAGWHALKNIIGAEARDKRKSLAESWEISEDRFVQMAAQVLFEAGWALVLRNSVWFVQLVH